MTTILTCILFTALVAALTFFFTRGKGTNDEEGYFLAGRSLTGVFIAGSLLLTNLSTEQLVGLNASAFEEGMSVMAWEVVAGLSLIVLALVFLPRYLKSGIATIPQFLEERYGSGVRRLTTFVFIVAYTLILLPFVLFLGAKGLSGMLDLQNTLGMSETGTIWVIVVFVALVGSGYAIFGGLRAVAVSDTFNGAGLLIGGVMITYFALSSVDSSIFGAFTKINEANPDAFKSLGKKGESAHWPTLFTGVLLLNFFYWTTNQQIIQRTFGAKNLAEGQKGVLLAAFFKILAPIILVIPGIVAAHYALTSPDSEIAKSIGGEGGKAYGSLVRHVLPPAFTRILRRGRDRLHSLDLQFGAQLECHAIFPRGLQEDHQPGCHHRADRPLRSSLQPHRRGVCHDRRTGILHRARQPVRLLPIAQRDLLHPPPGDHPRRHVQLHRQRQERPDHSDRRPGRNGLRHLRWRRELGWRNIRLGVPLHGSRLRLPHHPPTHPRTVDETRVPIRPKGRRSRRPDPVETRQTRRRDPFLLGDPDLPAPRLLIRLEKICETFSTLETLSLGPTNPGRPK